MVKEVILSGYHSNVGQWIDFARLDVDTGQWTVTVCGVKSQVLHGDADARHLSSVAGSDNLDIASFSGADGKVVSFFEVRVRVKFSE